jgi:hypothetical protein
VKPNPRPHLHPGAASHGPLDMPSPCANVRPRNPQSSSEGWAGASCRAASRSTVGNAPKHCRSDRPGITNTDLLSIFGVMAGWLNQQHVDRVGEGTSKRGRHELMMTRCEFGSPVSSPYGGPSTERRCANSSLSVKWPPRKWVLEICGRDRALPVGPLDVHLMHHRLPGRTVWMVRTRGVCAASPSLIWVHELQESPAT